MDLWYSFVDLFISGLRFLYNQTYSLGLAIIIFTLITRLLLLPLTLKSLRSQKKMQALQPRIRELQRKYGKDREKLAQETMKLYKEMGVNPAGGCLPILVQLPIFLAVYHSVLELVEDPQIIKQFLWIPDLGVADPYYILPVLSVVLQFVVQLMAMPRVQDPQQRAMSRAMLLMPIFLGYIAFVFPSGAVLYWVAGTIVAIFQQYFTTGWGSLVNYLPFLPKDKGFMNKDRAGNEADQGSLSADGQGALAMEQANGAVTQRLGFWDALSKLTNETEGQEQLEDVSTSKTRSQADRRPKRKKR